MTSASAIHPRSPMKSLIQNAVADDHGSIGAAQAADPAAEEKMNVFHPGDMDACRVRGGGVFPDSPQILRPVLV